VPTGNGGIHIVSDREKRMTPSQNVFGLQGLHEETLSEAEDVELFGEAFGKTLRMELYVPMSDRRLIGGRDRADLSHRHVGDPKHPKHRGAHRAQRNVRARG
jgi:hypothetical protein